MARLLLAPPLSAQEPAGALALIRRDAVVVLPPQRSRCHALSASIKSPGLSIPHNRVSQISRIRIRNIRFQRNAGPASSDNRLLFTPRNIQIPKGQANKEQRRSSGRFLIVDLSVLLHSLSREHRDICSLCNGGYPIFGVSESTTSDQKETAVIAGKRFVKLSRYRDQTRPIWRAAVGGIYRQNPQYSSYGMSQSPGVETYQEIEAALPGTTMQAVATAKSPEGNSPPLVLRAGPFRRDKTPHSDSSACSDQIRESPLPVEDPARQAGAHAGPVVRPGAEEI